MDLGRGDDGAALERLGRLHALQHAAARAEPPADAALRRDRLARLRALVAENQGRIVAAISADFGARAAAETRLMEIVPALGALDHARASTRRWMRAGRRWPGLTFLPLSLRVRHEPLGAVGVLSPWNYPLLLSVSPLAGILAAGNRAVLKPSELTPAFAALLAAEVAARFDEAELAVVTGGPEVGAALTRLPFDHIVFTGSTAVGRRVAQAAAANLVPVTLELGGKSPVLVCPDYPPEEAARSVAFGKFLNAGQTCIAPDYALVPAGSERAFAEAVLARVRTAYPQVAGNPDYTSIISPRHRERLVRALEEARAGGAEVLRHGTDAPDEGRIAPAVVLNPPPESLLMREEIFGPVLPVLGYASLDEALAFIAARDRPLAFYPFTRDREAEARVLGAVVSGGATVNGTILHAGPERLPFGGVGASGMGAYHGRDGFLRFSHARAVARAGGLNPVERLGPPWGRLAALAARLLIRR